MRKASKVDTFAHPAQVGMATRITIRKKNKKRKTHEPEWIHVNRIHTDSHTLPPAKEEDTQ